MSRLNQELGLIQGIALLSTSLLGTGIFVVPALAATGRRPEDSDLAEMDALWDEAKAAERT